MRKIILPICLLFTFCVQAQVSERLVGHSEYYGTSSVPIDSEYYSYSNGRGDVRLQSNGNRKYDTYIHERYNSTVGIGLHEERTGVFDADNFMNFELWDYTTNYNSVGEEKTYYCNFYSYTAPGIDSTLTKVWNPDNQSWHNRQINVNKVIGSLVMGEEAGNWYDNGGSISYSGTKYEVSYDNLGRMLSQINYSKFSNYDWVYDMGQYYFYDTSGYLVSRIDSEYSVNGIEPVKRIDYNNTNLPAFNEWYDFEWNGSAWDTTKHTFEYYNQSGNATYFYQETFGWSGWKKWMEVLKTYSPQPDSSVTHVYRYNYGLASDPFVNNTMYFYSYNQNGKLDTTYTAEWQDTAWAVEVAANYTYNQSGNIVYLNRFFSNGPYRHEYFYYENYMPNGLSEILPLSAVKLYPNPTTGNVQLHFLADNTGPVQVVIYDINATEVYRLQARAISGENSINFTLSHLAPGMYVYQCIKDNRSTAGKLIIE